MSSRGKEERILKYNEHHLGNILLFFLWGRVCPTPRSFYLHREGVRYV